MPHIYRDGELVEITEAEKQEMHATWEYRRNPDTDAPERRKVTPDGTVLVDWEDDPAARIEQIEAGQDREAAEAGKGAAIAGLSAGPVQDLLTILVAEGVVDPQTAREQAGWTPPA